MSLAIRPATLRSTSRPAASLAARPAAPAKAASWLATQQPPARTMEEGIARIEAVVKRLNAAGDRRAVFAATYAIQLRAFAEDVKVPGHYANPAWMTRMTLDFMQRYLDALGAYDRGDLARVPAAWKVAFDRAGSGQGPVVGDLLLAMNAHINHDLPLSVAATGPSTSVQADYRRFNEVLASEIDNVQTLITRDYMAADSLAAKGDRLLGRTDEALTAQTIRSWRDTAWDNGVAIAARGQAAYGAVQRRSELGARAIAGLSGLVPRFLIQRGQV